MLLFEDNMTEIFSEETKKEMGERKEEHILSFGTTEINYGIVMQ